MTTTTVEYAGEKREFGTKKAMLKSIGADILAAADNPMTVRQLYYRFVALDILENKESQYQYLCESIKEARLEGDVPWEAVEDRTREAVRGEARLVGAQERFNRAVAHLRSTPDRHEVPRWLEQPQYVEVWVEKDALSALFERAAEDLGVTTLACRGYPSVTVLKDAADRISAMRERRETDGEREATVVYFGDYDPSGQDIERHVRETLSSEFGVDVEVRRAALTMPQIRKHGLPPQPAKRTDARYETFVEEHGDMAVELDALPPDALRRMIEREVGGLFDEEIYGEFVAPRQERESEALEDAVSGLLDWGLE